MSSMQYVDEAGTTLRVNEYYGRNFLFTITRKDGDADVHLSVPEADVELIIEKLRAMVKEE